MATLLCLLLLAPGEVDDLVADLASKEAYARKVARKLLIEMGADAVPTVVKALPDAGPDLRVELAMVLAGIGPAAKEAVPALLPLLAAANADVREAVARALGGIGPDAAAAVAKLIGVGRSRLWKLRLAAHDALVAIGPASIGPLLNADGVEAWAPSGLHALGAKVVPVAILALKSKEDAVRARAAAALGAARNPIAVTPLMHALHDPAVAVRREAARAMGAIGAGAAEAVPALVALVGDERRRAVLQALEALGAIVRDAARRHPPPRKAAVRNAVAAGLAWLAAHQDRDGLWDCAGFAKHSPADDISDGRGGSGYSIGVTGLSVHAFLSSGQAGSYEQLIRRGLRRLVAAQDESGRFGSTESQHYIYNHACATLAMCAGWSATRNPMFGRSAQRALDFIAEVRHPEMAWRYRPRDPKADTSVTGWMVICLKEGQLAGLRVDRGAFRGALAWVEFMTSPVTGRVGYNVRGGQAARPKELQQRFPADRTRAMTAAGLLVRLSVGDRSEAVKKSAAQCLSLPPVWNPETGVLDMYYWFHATRAFYQLGGREWHQWSAAMTKTALRHQHPKGAGDRTGSWDPIGPWGADGGRVYSTAVMVACLNAVAGHVRPFKVPPPRDPGLRVALRVLKRARKSPEDAVRDTARNALAPLTVR